LAKTYKFANNSMSANNSNIPSSLQATKVVSDDILNSAGLYSKQDIEKARFSRFSRFGRVLDPYGKINTGREYLFFVKPDLHICKTTDEMIYKMSGFSDVTGYQRNGLQMNPQLVNNPYFKDLIDTHPDVIKELQYSICSDNNPFGHILSFSVSNSLSLGDVTIETLDNTPATTFGTSYKYLRDGEASDEQYQFSLEFVDNKNLDVYHFFKAYSEYHIARKTGLVTPPNQDYYRYKRLHNTMGVYKFIVAEDMETIIYWAYLWGVYPTSCPRDAFSDASFTDGLNFSVNFDAAFIEDMNPTILYQFNKLMMPVLSHYGCDKDHWLPVVRQNAKSDSSAVAGAPYNHSYDTSIGFDKGSEDLNKIYNIGITDRIDGTLPVAALVDGRIVNNESVPKYRLRWFAPK